MFLNSGNECLRGKMRIQMSGVLNPIRELWGLWRVLTGGVLGWRYEIGEEMSLEVRMRRCVI